MSEWRGEKHDDDDGHCDRCGSVVGLDAVDDLSRLSAAIGVTQEVPLPHRAGRPCGHDAAWLATRDRLRAAHAGPTIVTEIAVAIAHGDSAAIVTTGGIDLISSEIFDESIPRRLGLITCHWCVAIVV